jgi:(p)ppGpp synthase/HD superfamily hydrolase
MNRKDKLVIDTNLTEGNLDREFGKDITKLIGNVNEYVQLGGVGNSNYGYAEIYRNKVKFLFKLILNFLLI